MNRNWQGLGVTKIVPGVVIFFGILCSCQFSYASGMKFRPTSGGGHTIQDEGVSLTQRTNLDFQGAGVTATDGGAGPNSTIITIPGGGSATAGGSESNVQFNNATALQGDKSFNWNQSRNMLGISRDASQSGYALVISGDLATQGILANISHDGTAHFQALQLNNPLSSDQGGTGQSSYTKGDLLSYTSGTTLAKLSVGSAGQVLSADSSTATGLKWVNSTSINPSTIKGDIDTFGGTNSRLAVGSNGQVLSADSTTATGLNWVNATGILPQTTKGDISTFGGAPSRLPVGSNGQVLSVDSSAANGIKWAEPTPITTKGDLMTWITSPTRLAVGANGTVLSADSSTATGLRWVTPPTAGAGSGDMILASAQTNTGVKTFNDGTLKFPDVAGIIDGNGNRILSFDAVATSVNWLSIVDAATGTNPIISADGTDANVGVGINTRGTGGLVITQGTATAQQSTINSGLIVNNGNGSTTTGSFGVLSADGSRIISSDPAVGGFSFRGNLTSPNTQAIGWSVVAVGNQACNTTCTSACVFGEDTSVIGSFVDCTDATADRCLCAGPA